MNVDLLRSTWAEAQAYGDDLTAHFYTTLFGTHPELRPLFPPNMVEQRSHIHAMINLVVRADNLEAVIPRLQRLGRDHRGYGAVAAHFPVVVDTLVGLPDRPDDAPVPTLEFFLGDAWTVETAATWREALDLVAGVMVRAGAEASAAGEPLGWTATVYRVDRDDDLVDLSIAVADYQCETGDSVPLSFPDQPGSRRFGTVQGWTADGSLTVVRLAVTDLDPVTVQFGLIEPGEQIHLGAPLEPLTEGENPHGG